MIKPADPVRLPCCGVFAVFLADPKLDFDSVFDLTKQELKRTERWRGTMLWREVIGMLDAIGVRHSQEACNVSIGKTLQRAIREGDFIDGRQYVIRVSGHFLTIKGELCYDQVNPRGRHFSEYRHRRSKITHVAKVARVRRQGSAQKVVGSNLAERATNPKLNHSTL